MAENKLYVSEETRKEMAPEVAKNLPETAGTNVVLVTKQDMDRARAQVMEEKGYKPGEKLSEKQQIEIEHDTGKRAIKNTGVPDADKLTDESKGGMSKEAVAYMAYDSHPGHDASYGVHTIDDQKYCVISNPSAGMDNEKTYEMINGVPADDPNSLGKPGGLATSIQLHEAGHCKPGNDSPNPEAERGADRAAKEGMKKTYPGDPEAEKSADAMIASRHISLHQTGLEGPDTHANGPFMHSHEKMPEAEREAALNNIENSVAKRVAKDKGIDVEDARREIKDDPKLFHETIHKLDNEGAFKPGSLEDQYTKGHLEASHKYSNKHYHGDTADHPGSKIISDRQTPQPNNIVASESPSASSTLTSFLNGGGIVTTGNTNDSILQKVSERQGMEPEGIQRFNGHTGTEIQNNNTLNNQPTMQPVAANTMQFSPSMN